MLLLLLAQAIAPVPATATGMIESAIRAELKDPDSAKFNWPHGFVRGWYQPPMGRKYVGWLTCGTVNAKNSYGGYSGPAPVIGVIENGVVLKVDIEDPADGPYGGSVVRACRNAFP